MTVSATERTVLRDLARQVAALAALPIQAERRRLWTAHNGLRGERPMVLTYPEGAWLECLPPAAMVCRKPLLYGWEQRLRMQLYNHAHFGDDHVVDPWFNLPWRLGSTGWGLDAAMRHAEDASWRAEDCYHLHPNYSLTLRGTKGHGAYNWDPPLREPADIERLRPVGWQVDREASARDFDLAQELFGDLLTIRRNGWVWVMAGSAPHMVQLRGMEQLMMDVFDRPEWVHRPSRFIVEGLDAMYADRERQGLLCTNHQAEWVGTGGMGCTDELPAPGFHPDHVRRCDMWGAAQSQDLVGFSPAMLEEFFLQYSNPMLAKFGLNSYGCCEPLHDRIDVIRRIPNLRRVSISPWCDVAKAAAGFGRDYVFSWKPNPAMLSTERFDETALKKLLVDGLRVTREHGCQVEILMKDLHTVRDQPDRIGRYVQLAREAIDEVWE